MKTKEELASAGEVREEHHETNANVVEADEGKEREDEEKENRRVVLHGNKVIMINQCDTFVDPGADVANKHDNAVWLPFNPGEYTTPEYTSNGSETPSSSVTMSNGIRGDNPYVTLMADGSSGEDVLTKTRVQAHVYRLVNPAMKLQKSIAKLTMQQTPGQGGITRTAVEKSFVAEMRRMEQAASKDIASNTDTQANSPVDNEDEQDQDDLTSIAFLADRELDLQKPLSNQETSLEENVFNTESLDSGNVESISPSEKLEEIDSIDETIPGNYVLLYTIVDEEINADSLEGISDNTVKPSNANSVNLQSSEKRLIVVRKRPSNCCHVLELTTDISTESRMEQQARYGCSDDHRFAKVQGTSAGEIVLALKTAAWVLVGLVLY